MSAVGGLPHSMKNKKTLKNIKSKRPEGLPASSLSGAKSKRPEGLPASSLSGAKSLLWLFLAINLALTVQMAVAFAAPSASGGMNPIDLIQNIGKGTGLPDFNATGQHPDAPPDYAQPGVGTLTSPIFFAIDLFRYFISGIALIVITIESIKLISFNNDEVVGKAKSTLIMAVIGLLIIQIADVAVKKMFFGQSGDILETATTAQIYGEETVKQFRGIMGFIEILLGVIAVLVIVIRGLVLMTGGGEEESMTKAKNHVLYAVVGLFVIILSDVVIRGVIFPEAGKQLPNTQKAAFIIVSVINYVSGFVAIIAFLALFYAGYYYVVSAGNDEANEKVKKIITGAIISLALALGAFAIVNTLIKFEPAKQSEGLPASSVSEAKSIVAIRQTKQYNQTS
ncbi:hypothetical protein HZC20_03115 [Candidatus Peregrinibacteria bacterium]|nr:hypothetical protein [Candidatus Peregrinibacteria bacterium]